MGRLDALKGSGMYGRQDTESVPQAEEAPKPAFRRGADTTVSTTAEAKPIRRNAYAGDCSLCGGHVPANAGRLGPKVDGRWTVTHDEGGCASEVVVIQAEPRFTTDEVHPGIYTLEKSSGHRTFRVVLQGRDEDFAPGETILEYLTGPNNESDYKGFAFIKGGRLQVWKRFRQGGYEGLLEDAETFMADPDKATLVAKHCLRCGATLSTPESKARGLGPECAKRGF